MRRSHFAAFAPCCARCRRDGRGVHPLVLAQVFSESGEDVLAGILHCSNAACQHEYPIIDGIPVLVPELRRLLNDRGVEMLLRQDLPEPLESLIGDAVGPDSWLDGVRQTVSTYAWDSYADLDPAEVVEEGGPVPGAVRRCLGQLLTLVGASDAPGLVLDLGCAAGRTSFDLAAARPDALVVGMDSNLGLLRLARRVATGGGVRYARRRIGIAFDRREFPVDLPGAARVDFWAGDATCLPVADGTIGLAVGLNLLDCVPEPRQLVGVLAQCLAPGGQLLLASPYDWATRATPVESWIGGHSQRADHQGAAEGAVRAMLTPGNPGVSVPGLRLAGEVAGFPWHTRLHDRSAMLYRTHLLAAERMPDATA